MKKIYVYTDGGARNNPGPAGIGFIVYNEQMETIYQCGKCIGKATNNVAEYTALLESVKWLCSYKDSLPETISITFYSDSELMVKQIIGNYKIKNAVLKNLAIEVHRYLNQLNVDYRFNLIPREKNTVADKLVNDALDGVR